MHQLSQKLEQESDQSDISEKLCQGTLLAPLQYRPDVEHWHYQDARLQPTGNLTQADVSEWIDHLHQENDPAKTCEV
jgi:hypothetical protein